MSFHFLAPVFFLFSAFSFPLLLRQFSPPPIISSDLTTTERKSQAREEERGYVPGKEPVRDVFREVLLLG